MVEMEVNVDSVHEEPHISRKDIVFAIRDRRATLGNTVRIQL